MEQPSSSSKVTVEYFDPHGVYQLLSPGLLPRLPLRNLHWESHAGPLRSISSLHVDLVPSAHDTANTPAASSASVSNSSLSRVRSQDSASGDDGFRTQALGKAALERSDSRTGPAKQVPKERRHQIPGLRQTPYLKVFLLRCDDNDSYKNYARKEVRDWIKEHTPPAQSTTKVSNQENHDAYEWLIIHVIVPNTAAATQPRVSGKGAEGSGSTAEKATARWRGGGSTTILEKLRADFNGSSKSAIDRIAQIRIGINDVPYEMLPRVVPAIPGSYSETAHENETAWLDLINKFKSQILASFDMRVSQYEEDIREKDAQRSLPGWNFCTFFVLKEGLARGFESVGLVEDALVGYDELSVGLDTIIREKSTSGAGAQHGGSFLPYTEDLKLQVERAKEAFLKEKGPESVTESEDPIDLQSTGNSSVSEDEIPLDATKKRYRELILSNDVSIFDFRCYLFARQLSLLLRLANAWSSQEELLAKLKEQRESSLQGVAARNPISKPSEDVENLVMLGEVCKRAMNFVAAIGSIMREDILASYTHSQQNVSANSEKPAPDLEKDPVMAKIVDNIVASFTFGITQQILAQTSTKSLPIPPSTLAPPSSKLGLDGHEPKAAIPEPKTMMHPARSTSLAIRSQSHREPPSPGLFPGGRRASLPDPGATSTFLKTGLEDLAAHRAELYLLARNVLERVGKDHGWSVGWVELANEKAGDMEDVDLEETYFTPRGGENGQPTTSHPLHGIESKLLRTALDNQDDFYRLYETLTDKALRHYTVASHTQCVQSRMADLAVLKYHLNDYAAAASYFYRMTPFYGEGGWDEIELNMLKMYAKCLKELQRKEDYIRIVLKILAKAADIEKERLLHKSALRVGRLDNFGHDTTEIDRYMVELLQLTKALQHEIHVPLQTFFSRVEVNDAPHYFTDKDGISLKLRFRYLLAEELNIEKVRVRIVAATGEAGREIWLETEGPVLFKKGFVNVHVQTNMVIPGTYLVTHVTLHTSNIVLDYAHENSNPPLSRSEAFFRSPKLLIYHRAEAFDLKMFASRYMHLDRNRSLEIELSSGWNNVSKGELHVRAATAGLRVQTSQATVISGAVEIFKNSEVGVVQFGSLEPNSHAKLRMPFTLEHEVNDISLKLEVSYTTDKGDFFFATTPTMSIMLPLGVNVQDVFKHKALFSRFTISSSTDSPLRLLSSRLDNSEVFEADCGLGITKPVVIYPRQPASLLYKITKIAASTSAARNDPKSSLSLVLHYICLEEEIDLAVTQSLSQALKDTPLYPYARLVIPTVLGQLHANMSPYDLERTAVLNEVSTSILTSIRWQDHFAGLGRAQEEEKDTATLLSERLKQWLQQSPGIDLLPISLDQNAIAGSRSITIPVDVPSVTVVHTADLRLLESSTVVANTAVAATNQPIPASLHVKWTTTWDTESTSEQRRPSQPNANISELPEYLDFIYEVLAPSDTWLIGGKRKGHFKVSTGSQKKGQRKTFPVILVPLREGYLPYPHVEIQPAPVARPARSGPPGMASADGEEAKPVVTCETDYKNSGETMKVISDARKTTVSLDASGPQGGAWLLESERRTGGLVTG